MYFLKGSKSYKQWVPQNSDLSLVVLGKNDFMETMNTPTEDHLSNPHGRSPEILERTYKQPRQPKQPRIACAPGICRNFDLYSLQNESFPGLIFPPNSSFPLLLAMPPKVRPSSYEPPFLTVFVQVFLKLWQQSPSWHNTACLLSPMHNIWGILNHPALLSPKQQSNIVRYAICDCLLISVLQLHNPWQWHLRKTCNVWVSFLWPELYLEESNRQQAK